MGVDQSRKLNWCLEKHRRAITVLSSTFPDGFNDLLDTKHLPRTNGDPNTKTWLDWGAITPHFKQHYFVEGAEKAIRQGLKRSTLIRCSFLIMEYGYDAPVVQIETPVFVDFWDDFISSAEGGAVIIAKDENLAMEFTDDADYGLLSNFEIPPYEPDLPI
jgi:hypothetical protein